jgi:hypothetical protein
MSKQQIITDCIPLNLSDITGISEVCWMCTLPVHTRNYCKDNTGIYLSDIFSNRNKLNVCIYMHTAIKLDGVRHNSESKAAFNVDNRTQQRK